MKILMHICCAPCATFPVEELQKEGITVDGLFYNPNIHPYEEFKRREEQVRKLGDIYKMKIHFMPDYKQEIWENIKGNDKNRCSMCYNMRLQRLFKFAAMEKYDAVTSSLLISPYQNHEEIKDLCDKYSDKFGVDFLYRDFRPGYRKGQEKAKEHGFYRQRYCGCMLSLLETLEEIENDIKNK